MPEGLSPAPGSAPHHHCIQKLEEMGGKGVQTACKWSRLTGEELSELIKDTDNIAVTALK